MSYAIIRIVKHKSKNTTIASLKHQLRERETLNADSDRTHLNINSHTDSESAWHDIRARFDGAKMQKAAVNAVEYMITTSNETPENFDAEKYMSQALDFLKEKHGAENVVFSSMQFDETTPHLSVFVVPRVSVEEKNGFRTLKNGTQQAWKIEAHDKISASHFFDGKEKMRALQNDFFDAVGKQHGLMRGEQNSTAKHQDVQRFYEIVNKALNRHDQIAEKATESDYFAASKGIKNTIIKTQEERSKAFPVIAAVAKSNAKKHKRLKKVHDDLSVKEKQLNDVSKKLEQEKKYIKAALDVLKQTDPFIEDKIKNKIADDSKSQIKMSVNLDVVKIKKDLNNKN